MKEVQNIILFSDGEIKIAKRSYDISKAIFWDRFAGDDVIYEEEYTFIYSFYMYCRKNSIIIEEMLEYGYDFTSGRTLYVQF